jgi:carbon storage regulator
VLVYTRRPGESVKIGNDVTVKVTEIRDGQVRIAIDAPRSLSVHREEIYKKIKDGERGGPGLG